MLEATRRNVLDDADADADADANDQDQGAALNRCGLLVPIQPAPIPATPPWVQVESGTEVHFGRTVAQDQGVVDVLGRATNDETLSRRHARLALDDDGAYLVDLGSTKGTWVNGQRLLGKLGPGEWAVLLPEHSLHKAHEVADFLPALAHEYSVLRTTSDELCVGGTAVEHDITAEGVERPDAGLALDLDSVKLLIAAAREDCDGEFETRAIWRAGVPAVSFQRSASSSRHGRRLRAHTSGVSPPRAKEPATTGPAAALGHGCGVGAGGARAAGGSDALARRTMSERQRPPPALRRREVNRERGTGDVRAGVGQARTTSQRGGSPASARDPAGSGNRDKTARSRPPSRVSSRNNALAVRASWVCPRFLGVLPVHERPCLEQPRRGGYQSPGTAGIQHEAAGRWR